MNIPPSHNMQTSGQPMNPALLSGTYSNGQNKFGVQGMNSPHLMNGMGGMGPMGGNPMNNGMVNNSGGLNPAQMLNYQQRMNGMSGGGMNPMMAGINNANPMANNPMGGMNPSNMMLGGHSNNGQHTDFGGMGSAGSFDPRANGSMAMSNGNSHPGMGMQPNMMGGGGGMPGNNMPSQAQQANMLMILNSMGITREQFTHMPNDQKQMVLNKFKLLQQNQHNAQNLPLDRPSSSAGSPQHPSMPQSMMPPPQRPPTSQSSGPTRPPTAMDIQRTPSAMGSPSLSHSAPSISHMDNGMGGHGFNMGRPGPSHSPPPPGSPNPGAYGAPRPTPGDRRKSTDSPMLGSMSMNGMGQASAANGMNQMSMGGFSPSSPIGNMMRDPQKPAGMQGTGMELTPGPGIHGNGMPISMVNRGSQPGSYPPLGGPPSGAPSLQRPMSLGGPGQNAGFPSPRPLEMQMGDSIDMLAPSSRQSLPPSTPLMANSPSISRMPSLPPASTRGPVNAPARNMIPGLPTTGIADPATTVVTTVPLTESEREIPELSAEEIQNIQRWSKIDKNYQTIYKQSKERMNEEMLKDLGPRVPLWWEKGSLSVNPGLVAGKWKRGSQFNVTYPRSGKKDLSGRRKPKREGIRLPQKLEPEDVRRPEQLIPIRLEFDVDHHRMRDTFIWNLHDPVITPENFAQSLVEDYNMPPTYHAIIVRSIQDQLSDYKAHSSSFDADSGDSVPEKDVLLTGHLNEADAQWWESWKASVRARTTSTFLAKKRHRTVKQEDGNEHFVESDPDRAMSIDEFVVNEDLMHEEMRILIKLDITVGSVKLDDQFEWDIEDSAVSPEQFAEVYARELGLGGEFKTAIAHCIREQELVYRKSLFLVGYTPDGSAIPDDELKSAFLPSLSSGTRTMDQVQAYTPLLNYVSDGEIDRNEKEREKELNKRRKRNTRGKRGVALPDREPNRTYRTPAVGFPELDASALAVVAANSAPTSRRAAAAAASLNIANMVASENGMPVQSLLPTAQQATPTAAKEKKPRGLFKAPTVPPDALSSRAGVSAPTSSTAAKKGTFLKNLDNDPPPPPRAGMTIISTRPKEDVKEPELIEGQHPNMIEGVWHCSNCGCPESIAVGRRKGPLGDKSQCGQCGKYWHRHRRLRPVEWNPDEAYHANLVREAEMSKSSKKRGARNANITVPGTPADVPSEPQTPIKPKEEPDTLPLIPQDDRALSPVSSSSETSEAPLARKSKSRLTRGSPSRGIRRPTSSATDMDAPASEAVGSTTSPSISHVSSGGRTYPPDWLAEALEEMQARFVNHKFDITLRAVNGSETPEWRIRCLDCPGKLYKPGPAETLSNFEVHLKNRKHVSRVTARTGGDPIEDAEG